MKKINKRLTIILLSGCVLITGCNSIKNNEQTKKVKTETNTEKETKIQEQTMNNQKTNIQVSTTSVKNESIDEQITTYFNETYNSIDKEEIKEKAIEKFIVLTDFIFYDGEIKGVKFNDLKATTKEKVLDIYSVIDNKIKSKFPDYKENIAEKYDIASTYIKNKYIELSNDLKNTIKSKIGEETYKEISDTNKKIIEQDKKNLEAIKEKTEDTASKAKTKVKNWYQNLKNEH